MGSNSAPNRDVGPIFLQTYGRTLYYIEVDQWQNTTSFYVDIVLECKIQCSSN